MNHDAHQKAAEAYAEMLDALAFRSLSPPSGIWMSPELRDQAIYIRWRASSLFKKVLSPDFNEFKRTGPTVHPTAWNAWMVHRATRKMLGEK